MDSLYTSQVYLIKAIENMHVGQGSEGFGIIENQVQRDVVTEMPVIHASSLKGAFREYYHALTADDENNPTKEEIKIFGSDAKAEVKAKKSEAGTLRFFPGNLLSIPVRSNKLPYFNATSPALIQDFLDKLKLFGIISNPHKAACEELIKIEVKEKTPVIFKNLDGPLYLEDYEAAPHQSTFNYDLSSLFGENLALFHHDDFKDLAENLPVIARNQLENGESKNLWYEEIVPRDSRFYFFISHMQKDAHILTSFEDTVLSKDSEQKMIQIGANATVGYGYSTITKMGQPQ